MPYHYILANLLAANDASVGVMFLDESGETVDLACADYTPYQMKVLGAYVGIGMRQVGKMLETVSGGVPRVVHIERDGMHLFAEALPDGYYLVLVQHRPALVGKARATLHEAAEQLSAALF